MKVILLAGIMTLAIAGGTRAQEAIERTDSYGWCIVQAGQESGLLDAGRDKDRVYLMSIDDLRAYHKNHPNCKIKSITVELCKEDDGKQGKQFCPHMVYPDLRKY